MMAWSLNNIYIEEKWMGKPIYEFPNAIQTFSFYPPD